MALAWASKSITSANLIVCTSVSPELIFGAALSAGQRRAPSTTQIANNPESFTLFAVAAYIYQNPPATPAGSPDKPAVVFPGGIPRTVRGLTPPPGVYIA
jgi:hypothetical protein